MKATGLKALMERNIPIYINIDIYIYISLAWKEADLFCLRSVFCVFDAVFQRFQTSTHIACLTKKLLLARKGKLHVAVATFLAGYSIGHNWGTPKMDNSHSYFLANKKIFYILGTPNTRKSRNLEDHFHFPTAWRIIPRTASG